MATSSLIVAIEEAAISGFSSPVRNWSIQWVIASKTPFASARRQRERVRRVEQRKHGELEFSE
jgi:hypothetical protein